MAPARPKPNLRVFLPGGPERDDEDGGCCDVGSLRRRGRERNSAHAALNATRPRPVDMSAVTGKGPTEEHVSYWVSHRSLPQSFRFYAVR